MGVLLLISGALIIVATIAYGILANRTAYFEQRNLRELDRIAAELTATRENLAQTAALHFVPRQLHFSLSPGFECLSATTQIMGERHQPITIAYYFTDPRATREIAEWYAAQTPRTPAAGSPGPPSVTSRPLPENICGYQRPLGLPVDTDETVNLGDSDIRIEWTARLTNLLWPMTARDESRPQDLSRCLDDPEHGSGPASDMRSFITNCFVLAAMEDMRDETYSYRVPSQHSAVVAQSIDAATRSNTIRINVSTGTDALNLDAALDYFDAVQVIGSDARNQDRPILLHQAGRVPAAIEGSESDEARVLSTITGLAASPTRAGQGTVRSGREGDFLAESRIFRTGDLILFQRTVSRLAGLHCNPCRIVGIVERSEFNETVRKIDGVQATMFLIGILSLIGSIPLLQLKLRRRLDAVGRVSQYVVWFSLTLLAASASVCALAIWSASASRNAGATYSGAAIARIVQAFDAELRQSLPLIGRIGSELDTLPTGNVVFPAPQTLPYIEDLTDWGAFRAGLLCQLPDRGVRNRQELAAVLGDLPAFLRNWSLPAVERTMGTAWTNGSPAAIIESVSYFRGDGFLERQTPRIAASRFPAFGTLLADRPYFARARNRGFDHITLSQCQDGREGTPFILDRVFARTDGAPRVVWVMPAKRACRSIPLSSPPPPAPAASGETGDVTAADSPAPTGDGAAAADSPAPAAANDRAAPAGPPPPKFAEATGRAGPGSSAAPAAPEAAPPDTAESLAPVYSEDRTLAADPTTREFLVASGTLRTFLSTSLSPGFNYAVISPDRRSDEANVLFHSRAGAALVERFQHEIDDPERFNALVREALAPRDDAPTGGPRPPEAQNVLRMDTNYRARPTRLSVARLHPDMNWILVIIEDRDDAGFAIWRAATFGYAIWFFGALVVGLTLLFAHMRGSRALDRRPGLSLWPRKRLDDFTPPQTERKAEMKRRLAEGAAKRDRHIGWVLCAGVIGVAAAEGASRILIAFAAAATALVAQAYFQGMTAPDNGEAKRSDRRVIWWTFALLAIAALAFVPAIAAEYRFRDAAGRLDGDVDPVAWLRILGFLIAVGLLAKSLVSAFAYTDGPSEAPDPNRAEGEGWLSRVKRGAASLMRRSREQADRAVSRASSWPAAKWIGAPPRWLAGKVARVQRFIFDLDVGWMAVLIVTGAIPAMAGFLDSFDYDRFLLIERADQTGHLAREERRQAIDAINIARLAKLPDPLIEQVVDAPVTAHRLALRSADPAAALEAGRPRPDISESCSSLSCLAIFLLDLRAQALEFSDFAAFHMGVGRNGALSSARGYTRWTLLLVAAIPFALLFMALMFFKQQYFHRPPLLSPGKDPDFDPPLSFTRRDFISKALLPAAKGDKPMLPFKPAGGNRHLILGIGLDLRDEWASGNGKRLSDLPGIEWVDLLELDDPPATGGAAKPAAGADPVAAASAGAKAQAADPNQAASAGSADAKGAPAPDEPPIRAVVIGNLDLALQVADDGRAAERAYRAIKAISDGGGADQAGRHVFLLADIDPLDRIALLWEQQDREEATSLIKGWRWAELIQDFTLFPIRHDHQIPTDPRDTRVLRTIREELGVLDIGFARELRDRLMKRMQRPRGRDEHADAERIVSFIAEQMSDYYHKLWASSSDEERVILYRIALDCHLKMKDSRGLRSLLARGLLVRVPEYRLMNRSFTRYVRRVGATSGIHQSAQRVGGIDWVWPLIRYPLAAVAGSAVLLLQFVAPSSATGAVGALPALLTLVPALLGKWFKDRGAA